MAAHDDETLSRRHDHRAVPDLWLLESERHAAVRSAVTSLPWRDRVLLTLLYSHAKPSYAEVGRSMRVPIGSIGPPAGARSTGCSTSGTWPRWPPDLSPRGSGGS